jgi:hypothetical protein
MNEHVEILPSLEDDDDESLSAKKQELDLFPSK